MLNGYYKWKKPKIKFKTLIFNKIFNKIKKVIILIIKKVIVLIIKNNLMNKINKFSFWIIN